MRTYRAAAESRAPPLLAAGVILDPGNLPRWFRGAAVTRADPTWPEPGSTMEWRVARIGAFRARAVEGRLPDRVVMDVDTPSGASRITHTFAATPGGGTRYEKVVETEQRGLAHLFVPLFLPRAMQAEVTRACALADEALTTGGSPATGPR